MKFPITIGIRSTKEKWSTWYSTWGREERRTLGIEEGGIVPEVRPLEHTPQFRDVLLSVRSHCVDPPSAHDNFIHPHLRTPTLLIIANEYYLPQGRLVHGQYRQVIPNLDLTRFVDDDSLDRDDRRESAIHDPARRQHADCAKDDPSSQH